MRGIIILSFVLTVVFASGIPVLSQEKAKRSDYKLVRDDSSYEFGRKTYFFDYEFKGVPVETIEKYFRDSEEQNNGFIETTKQYEGCGMAIDLFNDTGKINGKKVACDDKTSKRFVIIYSHFDSSNEVDTISAASRKIVEDFTKGICPYALHLYGDPTCPNFDD
jgi:hypothetical protein